ncbi:hypothetical protein TrCOL_g8833 [Triparma columacea]|uniref:Uncharacterized protein n=1 Tax=Triparma columacea TaxID=722753 RepID=A0A9W7LFA0_9STRA|nr:hypothetical protein TrCOL_g8833 [Triparma columacea]
MIGVAASRTWFGEAEKKRFRAGNAESWGEDNQFELVTCMFGFHEMPAEGRDHHQIHPSSLLTPPLPPSGSSAGALVSTATLLHCSPTSLLSSVVSPVSLTASAAGPLGSLKPGVSLVDVMSPFMEDAIRNETGLDEVELDSYVRNELTNRLRVHLTSPTCLTSPLSLSLGNPSLHSYHDTFPTYRHLHAANILSSYVPIATGYLDRNKGVVKEATTLLRSLPAKRGIPGSDGGYDVIEGEEWVDGGLSIMWPTVDSHTIVVSPVTIKHRVNKVICPRKTEGARYVKVSKDIEVEISLRNIKGGRDMIMPKDVKMYEQIFEDAYEDAERVLGGRS